MTIQRIPQYPYPPSDIKDKAASDYLRRLYTSLANQARMRGNDFDILQLSNVSWVDVRKHGSFSAAIDAIGSTEAILLIPDEQAVSADKTVPSNVTLLFTHGGSLNIADAKTVTINGHVEAGLYQIFKWTGTGKVIFGASAVKEVSSEWWGAKFNNDPADAASNTSAITAALAAFDVLSLSPGTIYIDGPIPPLSNKVISGKGQFRSIIRLADSAPNGTDVLTLLQENELRDFRIWGNWDGIATGLLGIGIRLEDTVTTRSEMNVVEDIYVSDFKEHCIYGHNLGYTKFNNVKCHLSDLEPLSLEGDPGNFCTTVEIKGESVFSNSNTYGMRLKNCIMLNLSFISEDTKGVLIEGPSNNTIVFETCYWEQARGTIPYIINITGGGAGVSVLNSYLGMLTTTAAIQGAAAMYRCIAINNQNGTGQVLIDANLGNWAIIDRGMEDWIAPTLLNSWINYGSPYIEAGYFKDVWGMVHLRGMVKNGTMGQAIFTLPLGYRPPGGSHFPVASNDAWGEAYIDISGNVIPAAGSNAWFCLNGIIFRPV
jgi:hypothetical protein